MTVYVLRKLDGVSTDDLKNLSMVESDYFTAEDLEDARAWQVIVLEDMREAAAHGDLDRVEYLDSLYDDLMQIISKLAASWPDDYEPPSLDESRFG